MGGGLLNLVAVGSQNIILNGNPQISFFKAVYKKYTNFGLQKFRIDYNGLRKLNFKEPTKLVFKVPRYAELLMDTYIVVNLPNIWSPIIPPGDCSGTWLPYEFKWIPNIGFHMISEIEISVGGQILQKFSGEYMLNQMRRDFSKEKTDLVEEMIGHSKEFYDPANYSTNNGYYPNAYYTPIHGGAEPSIRGRKLYIPINSWFTMTSKLAFPLVCLQYNELNISVTFRPVRELCQIRDIDNTVATGASSSDLDNYNDGYQNKFTNGLFKLSKYWGFPIEEIPYIAPNPNNPYQHFYRFLQTPPTPNVIPQDYVDYGTTNDLWNADVHLMSTYCFLSEQETKLFAASPQKYLIKEVREQVKYNVSGAFKYELSTMGMVSDWMFFFRRSDVILRNEWNNYTNWEYENKKPRPIFSLVPSYGNAQGEWKGDIKAGTNPTASNIYKDTGSNLISQYKYFNDFMGHFNVTQSDIIGALHNSEDYNARFSTSATSLYDKLTILPSIGNPCSPSSSSTGLLPGINPLPKLHDDADNDCDCKEAELATGTTSGSADHLGWRIAGAMPYVYPPIKITGNYTSENQESILLNMGILLDGKYREDVLDSGIYKYVEKYSRTNAGSECENLYCYNFCLNSSYLTPTPSLVSPQPTGAINLSKFNRIELEMNTYIPPLDPQAQTAVICNEDNSIIGVNKASWDIYQYTYNLHIMEARYNIVNFQSGNVGLEWAR